MKKCIIIILVIFNLSSFFSLAQNKQILRFDLKSGLVDTLDLRDFDSTINKANTTQYLGNFNSSTIKFSHEVPDSNTFLSGEFTKKAKAAIDFDISDYPIRTIVKLFALKKDTLRDLCTGSLISKRHVLTACHCVTTNFRDSLRALQFFAAPAYDNGIENSNFESSWASKVYFFKKWFSSESDIAVIELENPIGEKCGWMGIGFNSVDSILLDGMFYKFSYPAITDFRIDSNSFNGDTLYYYYGRVSSALKNYFYIPTALGIQGESGSPLIKIEEDRNCTVYGVLNYSYALAHNRITNWKYYGIKQIIENELNPLSVESNYTDELEIYPNPASSHITIDSKNSLRINKINIYNSNSELVLQSKLNSIFNKIDISTLLSGQYYLIIEAENKTLLKRIIKL